MVRRLTWLFLLFVPLAAFALTLVEARQQGLVGEDSTGYIASISPNPSADVRSLVDDVNAQRRAFYEKIAKDTSTPTDLVTADAVGRRTAAKIFDKEPLGTYLRNAGESWHIKIEEKKP